MELKSSTLTSVVGFEAEVDVKEYSVTLVIDDLLYNLVDWQTVAAVVAVVESFEPFVVVVVDLFYSFGYLPYIAVIVVVHQEPFVEV